MPSLFVDWLAESYAEALAPIEEACEAAGRPPGLVELRARALWAAGRGEETVRILAGEARGGSLDPERWSFLAQLVLEPGSGIQDPVAWAESLSLAVGKTCAPFLRTLAFLLEKKGRAAESLRAAIFLGRTCAWEASSLPGVLVRLGKEDRQRVLRDLLLQIPEKTPGFRVVLEELAQTIAGKCTSNPEDCVRAVRQLFPLKGHATRRLVQAHGTSR